MDNLSQLIKEKEQEINQNGDIDDNYNLDYGDIDQHSDKLYEAAALINKMEENNPVASVPKKPVQTNQQYQMPNDNSGEGIQRLYEEKIQRLKQGQAQVNQSQVSSQNQLFITEEIVINKIREVLNKNGLSKKVLESVLNEMVQPYIEIYIDKEVNRKVKEMIPDITKMVIQTIKKRKSVKN